MRTRTLFFAFAVLILSVFALLNWATFTAPTRLNVIFGSVEAPLGLLMLGAVAFLSVLYLLILARAETTALREFRELSRELEKARTLAEERESSRFTELRDYLEAEITGLRHDIRPSSKIEDPTDEWRDSKIG